MAENDAFGLALREAKRAWESRHDPDRLSLAAIGARAAVVAGREQPFTAAAVSRWFAGQEPESFTIVFALADVLGVNPYALFQRDAYSSVISLRLKELAAEGKQIPEAYAKKLTPAMRREAQRFMAELAETARRRAKLEEPDEGSAERAARRRSGKKAG